MFSSSGGYSKREKAKAHPKQKAYYKVELTRNIVLINIKMIDMILKKMAYQKIQVRVREMKSGKVRGKSSSQRKWHEQKHI